MKVLFMGTPDFAVACLKGLIDANYEVCAVFTQPDKPRGRKMVMTPPDVKVYAQELNLPVYQPTTLKDGEALEIIKGYEPDVIVVAAYGKILPKSIIDYPKYGCVNVHGSILPKYRGAAPIQWSVINGDKETGVTTMQMNEGLDTGDMIMKTEIVLDKKETGGSLFDKLAAAGAKLCVETLEALENKTASWEPQGETPTAYARMLDKEIGNIKWAKTAVQIERLIRGLNPWPSAYTDWNGKVMKIWEADVVEKDTDAQPGTIVKVEKDGFCVQTGKGQIKVKALQIPGKKRMEADAFLRGYQIEEGTLLS
jgi:methionyl-tRNA formyltransferase